MKQPLILLPGLMCDRTVWEAQITALSDIADSQPMEWRLEHDSFGKMAEAVLASAPARFALAGHSMGGRVAFEVLRRAPERVMRIAVMNTGVVPLADGAAGEEEERGRRRLLELAFAQGIPAMAAEWLKGMVPAHRMQDTALIQAIVSMFERKTPELFLVQQEALLARPDARPLLPQIACSALVLTGEDDVWSPPVRHQEIAAAIPNAKLVLIPKSGHMSTMERPGAVADAMRDWLTS
ncbi:MAG: alpha/beta hydrolase [Acidobacteriota bacterium]